MASSVGWAHSAQPGQARPREVSGVGSTSSLSLGKGALVAQAQKRAGATAPPPTAGYTAAVTTTLAAFAWSTVVTVLGILLVPIITGILLFSVFRAVGSLWRGAV